MIIIIIIIIYIYSFSIFYLIYFYYKLHNDDVENILIKVIKVIK